MAITTKNQRVGGLATQTIDPAVVQWVVAAAENKAALSKKQRQDRQRVRVKYDLPPWLKQSIEALANDDQFDTSASQAAAFLLAYGVHRLRCGDQELRNALMAAKEPARTLQFSWNLVIPEEWTTSCSDGDS
jgi:hypothetical protein